MLLARDSIVGISIPSSISLPASLFTCSIIHHLVTNSLVTLLASFLWWYITEKAQRYLSVTRSDKSQSWFTPTQQTPSEIPVEHLYDHPVTLWRKAFLRYPGVANLIVEGICIWHEESNNNKLNNHYAKLMDGSCPSHHSPNDVTRYQMTTHVYG